MGTSSWASSEMSCFDKTVGQEGKADYTIYFDTNESDLTGVCNNVIKTEFNDIQLTGCKHIVLIGSADSRSSNEYNAKLSQSRAEHIKSLFNQSYQSKVIVRSAGESEAYLSNANNQDLRTVSVYVDNSCSVNISISQKACLAAGGTWLNNTCNCPDSKLWDTDTKTCMTSDEMNYKLSINKIKQAYNNIMAFDASVWKDSEGTFNKSRLLSDSLAGVVLGTAGGLITGKVIKKNQIENGFDDINCTVSGQAVAGWGDQFTVGSSK